MDTVPFLNALNQKTLFSHYLIHLDQLFYLINETLCLHITLNLRVRVSNSYSHESFEYYPY